MTVTQRIRLLGFGLLMWVTGMFTAAETTEVLLALTAPVMCGLGGGLFATALLPGRMARFS